VLSVATRILRLAFTAPETVPPPGEAELLDFVAYAADRQLVGLLSLEADRLTDLLNAADEIELLDITSLAFDGQVRESSTERIARSDLLVVKAGEPRGNPARRHRTRQLPVAAGIGPYIVYGYLHARAGADPLIDLGRRPPMIPLTDASISFEQAGVWRREDASTFIVNRDRADFIRPARSFEFTGDRQGVA
jgi:hypothetical protein